MSSHSNAPGVSFREIWPADVTNRVLLVVSVVILLAFLGCGSSSSSGIPITGNFGNSSLNGHYTFQLFGIDTTGNYYAEAGTFVADGNGHITSGTDDFNQNGSFTSNPITGNYTIGSDGNGLIVLTLPGAAGSFQLTVTMLSTSKLYLTEADTFANASGEASKQDTTAFATAPSGTFVLHVHALSSLVGSVATVGALHFSGTTITGTLDVLRNHVLSPVTLTSGTVAAPDTTGRGTLVITDSLAFTSHYVYYIIDTHILGLIQTDQNYLALGSADGQSAGPFTLSGNFALGSQGDTATVLGVRTVGAFSTTTAGNVGTLDSVTDGTSVFNQTIASVSVTGPDANGRATVVLTPSGGNPIIQVYWMVNSSQAVFLVNDATKVEDGTADQSTSSITTASLKGQYALVNDGFTPNNFLTRVGTFIPDGNGNVNLNEVVNAFTGSSLTSTVQQVQITGGTYQVGSGGRVTAALPSLSNNLVLYMVSPSQAYMLQNDPGVEISGKITLQVSP